MTRDSGPTVQSQTVGGELMRLAAILEMLPIAKDEHEYIRRGMADDLRAIARWVDQTLTLEMVEKAVSQAREMLNDPYNDWTSKQREGGHAALDLFRLCLRQEMGGGQG